MSDPMEEAIKKVRKETEGLSNEEKNMLLHKKLTKLQEEANIYERLEAARAFVAALDDAAGHQE